MEWEHTAHLALINPIAHLTKKKKRYLLIHDVSLISSIIYFLEYEDGDLSSWINRERFQGYLNVDGFTLYELGDTGEMLLHMKSDLWNWT